MNEQNKKGIMKRIVFHTGPVDGLLGTQTRGALAAFQGRSSAMLAYRQPPIHCRIPKHLETGRAAQQRAARLLSLPADNFAAVGDMDCPFVFEADMHPEREAATLNKCKPQKV
jgi:hypothetical protein